MATRIEIPQFDMYSQIFIGEKEGYVDIYDDYIFLNQQYLCKIPASEDEVHIRSREGWVETAIHQRINLKKENISLIALVYDDEHEGYELWKVKMYISGIDSPLSIYFKKKKDAEAAFDVISIWWLR